MGGKKKIHELERSGAFLERHGDMEQTKSKK